MQLLGDCFLFSVTAPISFDDPPQTETLNHLTANRAKVPQKRPPSKVLHSIMSHSHKSLNMFKSCFFFTEAAHCTFIDGRLGQSCNMFFPIRILCKSPCLSVLYYFKAQQRLKEYASLNNGHNNCPRNYRNGIFLQVHMFRSINRSLRPTVRMPWIICVFGDFYESGTQDAEITK